MNEKIPEPLVEETSEYDNCMDIAERDDVDREATLSSFIGMDDQDEVEFWKKHWNGMPEFEQNAKHSYKTISVHFRTEEDYIEFSKVLNQGMTHKTKSIWFPELEKTQNSLLRWVVDDE